MNLRDAESLESQIDQDLAEFQFQQADADANRYLQATANERVEGDPARSPRVRACYLAAQVSLAVGRLREALERIGAVRPWLPQFPPFLQCKAALLEAEACARLGHLDEGRNVLAQAVRVLPDLRRHAGLFLQELRIRLWLREVGELARELGQCARALADDPVNLVLLHCEEGRAWDAAGDLTRAEQCWREAERLGRVLGDHPMTADVLIQLGRLDHLRGRLPDAQQCFEKAMRGVIAGAQTLEIQLRRLLVQIELGVVRPDDLAARQLLDLSASQATEELRPLLELVRGLLSPAPAGKTSDEALAYQAAMQGNREAARALYQSALAAAAAPQRRARILLALGLLASGEGNEADANAWLSEAEGLAREHQMPEVLGRALQAQGQQAAGRGDVEQARRLFEQAVQVFEVQAAQFAYRTDAAAYRNRHGSVLRYLLREAHRRGDAGEVFHLQELERGRLVLELWRAGDASLLPGDQSSAKALDAVEAQLGECQRKIALSPQTMQHEEHLALLGRCEKLKLERDHLLEQVLRDRSRRTSAALPALPGLAQLQRALPGDALYLAPTVVEDELYLLAVRRDQPPRVQRLSGAIQGVVETLAGFTRTLSAQLVRYGQGLPMGQPERGELDRWLDQLGHGPLGRAIDEALSSTSIKRLFWVPDASLHALPLCAVRRAGRYLIEDYEIVAAPSGAMVVHQHGTRRQRRGRFRPALVVTESRAELPFAEQEGSGVAGSFLWSRALSGSHAKREAVRRELARARVAHFACHAHFDSDNPLSSYLLLPSGEKIHLPEWLHEPIGGINLITLSACRSGEAAPFSGREMIGLAVGLLGGGARIVLAGLWPLADRETAPFMWRFYRELMLHEAATALAYAQRETLRDPESSPLFWAPFVLHGDSSSLPAPCVCLRWLARWRQRRHEWRCGSGVRPAPESGTGRALLVARLSESACDDFAGA